MRRDGEIGRRDGLKIRWAQARGGSSPPPGTNSYMKRIERKLFRLGDEIRSLDEAIRLAREELIFHDHLNDDAQRDAAVSDSPLDRADARETAGDLARMRDHIAELERKRDRLDAKRQKLLANLD